MRKVYIIAGIRTPIGKIGGILKKYLPEQLAGLLLNSIVEKYHLNPEAIDMVMLGNAVGPGGNIARISVLEAGWAYSIPGVTVDIQCGSGLGSLMWAADRIQAGQADLIIAGGVESTSMAPKRKFNINDPRFSGCNDYYERAPFSPPSVGDPDIGEAAESVAKLTNISREAMDSYALLSHKKAYNAHKSGMLTGIIKSIDGINMDECIRPHITPKLLQRLSSAFMKDGIITAGNACLKHDGAAVVLLASEAALKRYNLIPSAEFVGSAIAGSNPNTFLLSPIESIKKLLNNNSLSIKNIDAIEINEAFAVKVLACSKALNLDSDKINILGGALAYGHPYGASGAIILLHLLKALELTDGTYGVASIGAVGGLGVSILIKCLKGLI